MSGQVHALKKSQSCLDYDAHQVRVMVMQLLEVGLDYCLHACQVSVCGTAVSDACYALRRSWTHCVAGWMLMPLLHHICITDPEQFRSATYIQAIKWV